MKNYAFTVNFQMITDRVYLADGARATKLQAAVTKSPVYFYLFGYRGKHSFTEVNSGTTNNYGKIEATPVLNKMLMSINRFLSMKSAYQHFKIQESSCVYCYCVSHTSRYGLPFLASSHLIKGEESIYEITVP
jgi:hypothetical protein